MAEAKLTLPISEEGSLLKVISCFIRSLNTYLEEGPSLKLPGKSSAGNL